MIILNRISAVSALFLFCCVNLFGGGIISINFAQGVDQEFDGGSNIGPLAMDSSNWNSTLDRDSGDLVSGSMSNLRDNSGSGTGVSVNWTASNTYRNGVDGTADDQHRLVYGYLDDGGSGISVVFSNIPYAHYRVYGMCSTDQGGGRFTTRDFKINGGVWAMGGGFSATNAAYGNITTNNSVNGEFWTEIIGKTRGNYWTIMAEGETLTIQGLPRVNDDRGCLSAVIIEEVVDDVGDEDRRIGFSFRRDVDWGDIRFTETAGAAGFTQRCWLNLCSDWHGDPGAVPEVFCDSLGIVVGRDNSKTNGLALEFDGPNLWNNSITNAGADYALMAGYLDSTESTNQPYIQILNIPYEIYNIVLYVDGDGVAGDTCGAYWLEQATDIPEEDGVDLTPSIYCKQIGSPDFDGTYTRVPLTSTDKDAAASGNYIVFKRLKSRNITIRGKQPSGTIRTPINAFQIVNVPKFGMTMILR